MSHNCPAIGGHALFVDHYGILSFDMPESRLDVRIKTKDGGTDAHLCIYEDKRDVRIIPINFCPFCGRCFNQNVGRIG